VVTLAVRHGYKRGVPTPWVRKFVGRSHASPSRCDKGVAPCGRRPTVAAMARTNANFDKLKTRLLDPEAGACRPRWDFPLNLRRTPLGRLGWANAP
jgi:hypothetical protein